MLRSSGGSRRLCPQQLLVTHSRTVVASGLCLRRVSPLRSLSVHFFGPLLRVCALFLRLALRSKFADVSLLHPPLRAPAAAAADAVFDFIDQDDDNYRGVLRGHTQSPLGLRHCRLQVGRAAQGEERGGTGVRDHRRWKRPRPAVRQGVRPETRYTGVMGHKQPKQRGNGGDGAEDIPRTGHSHSQRR